MSRGSDIAEWLATVADPARAQSAIDRFTSNAVDLGAVRCKCTVEGDGIWHEGKVYKSLSAAAMAAANDLGIGGATQNGFTFWGLSKRPRPAADPIESLGRAWERYRARASAIVGAVKDDDRDRVHSALGEHLDALKDLRGRVA